MYFLSEIMAEQTQHIFNIPENLIDRLSFIKITPSEILCEGFSAACIELVQEMYPQARINTENKVELILSLETLSEEKVAEWKKRLKPGYLVLFGVEANDFPVREIGDYLAASGFVNVVIDVDEGAIYGHAWMPKGASIAIHEIRRR
jgi:hypothetical protein